MKDNKESQGGGGDYITVVLPEMIRYAPAGKFPGWLISPHINKFGLIFGKILLNPFLKGDE